jgi:hypothetical protein
MSEKHRKPGKKSAVAATIATLALASQANKIDHWNDASPDTYDGHTNQHEQTHHVPVQDLDKNATITIKVRKDETAGGIAQDLMAAPEDFTKIEDAIQDEQEVPSVLAQGTVVHLDASEVDAQALAQRRHSK